jgi:hypothetical protein
MHSLDELEAALPTQMRGKMTQEMLDNLNKVVTSPELAENVMRNLVSYTSVLASGSRFRLQDYMNAVVYVSFKLMGYTDRECYQRTFPDRYADLLAKGTDAKDIAAYVSAYNKNVLVNRILEQSLIPTWVLNQDAYQKAINHQIHLMLNAKSEQVQQKAADSILNHLKKPESHKVELNIGMTESTEVADLKTMMANMVEKQKEMLEAGMKTRDIAQSRLIEGKAVKHVA